jgi:hypothetical protein
VEVAAFEAAGLLLGLKRLVCAVRVGVSEGRDADRAPVATLDTRDRCCSCASLSMVAVGFFDDADKPLRGSGETHAAG